MKFRGLVVIMSALLVSRAAFGGACCFDDGTCQDFPIEAICTASGGEYLGNGTTCATSSCDGACCLPAGSCMQLLPDACDAAGGFFQGRGTLCADYFCGLAGCCLPDETCSVLTFVNCDDEGGLHLGAGQTCDRIVCAADTFDFPLSPGSEVLALDRFDTMGGLRMLQKVTVGLVGEIGAQTMIENLSGSASSGVVVHFEATLDVNDIPGIALSAVVDETMPVPTLAPNDGVAGSGADFLDLGFISAGGRDMDMLTAPPDDLSYFIGAAPFPATVEAAGLLTATSSTSIAFTVSNFRAFGSVLVAYRFILLGACCYDDGSCSIETEADCLSDPNVVFFEMGLTCQEIACGNDGACCFVDASCQVLTESECAMAGGVFQGPGTTCLGLVCRGACCLANGTCLFISEQKCIKFGGTYYGDGVNCTSHPCPTSHGACCFPNDTCQIMTPAVCMGSGGEHQGAGTACDANSCGIACPADVAGPFGVVPDGNVDALDLLMMLAEWSGSCISGCHGDVTGTAGAPDGQVDSLDFLLLVSQWGSPAACGP